MSLPSAWIIVQAMLAAKPPEDRDRWISDNVRVVAGIDHGCCPPAVIVGTTVGGREHLQALAPHAEPPPVLIIDRPATYHVRDILFRDILWEEWDEPAPRSWSRLQDDLRTRLGKPSPAVLAAAARRRAARAARHRAEVAAGGWASSKHTKGTT